MNHRLNRRSVLKGVGLGAGAVLLSPVLSQLTAHAAGAASLGKKRFVFVIGDERQKGDQCERVKGGHLVA